MWWFWVLKATLRLPPSSPGSLPYSATLPFFGFPTSGPVHKAAIPPSHVVVSTQPSQLTSLMMQWLLRPQCILTTGGWNWSASPQCSSSAAGMRAKIGGRIWIGSGLCLRYLKDGSQALLQECVLPTVTAVARRGRGAKNGGWDSIFHPTPGEGGEVCCWEKSPLQFLFCAKTPIGFIDVFVPPCFGDPETAGLTQLY